MLSANGKDKSATATTTSSAAAASAGDHPHRPRGAFIVLEGVDRCGKTTQAAMLLDRLQERGTPCRAMRFPDRTTCVGQIIDRYLRSSTDLNDGAIHLLFSANRWEASDGIRRTLRRGTTIVCDRYAYSGVAFSAAKVKEQPTSGTTTEGTSREGSEADEDGEPVLSLEWCQAPDRGLPAPDCVIFLDLSQEDAEKRGG